MSFYKRLLWVFIKFENVIKKIENIIKKFEKASL